MSSLLQLDLICSVFIYLPRLSPQSSNTPHECVLRCASLLTGVLAAYVCMGLLTEEEACRSPLFLKAKVGFSIHGHPFIFINMVCNEML